ncbi:MAG: TolC family protein [Verrucomicrobia bacterium]|nr:TolC family protein [Verrucomicrobiota bacterium]
MKRLHSHPTQPSLGAIVASVLGLMIGCALAAPAQSTNLVLESLVTPAGSLGLSLEHCLELALGGNLDIQAGRQGPIRSGEQFFIAREAFVPSMLLQARREDLERRTANTQVGAEILQEATTVVDGRIRKRWSTGTRTDLAWAYQKLKDNSEFRTLNPSHESSVAIELTQPLLKGFGLDVNRADLARAVYDKTIADKAFEILLEGELLSTTRSYWDLVRSAMDLELQEASLELANEQVAIVADQLTVGSAAPLDRTAAEAAAARQEEAVITALNRYQKASDSLLVKIHPVQDLALFDLTVIPTTEPEFTNGLPAVPALQAALDNAFSQRPELAMEAASWERTVVDVMEARDSRRPALNAFGRYGFNGLDADAGGSIDDVTGTSFPEWTVGISLEFLFSGRSREARWRQALSDQTAAGLREQRTRAMIAQEVRTAVFDMQAAIQRLAAAGRTLDLYREQYEGELDRLKVGSSTVFQLDSLRRDLLDAERNHLDARVSLSLAQAVLEATQGQYAKRILASTSPQE